MPYQRFEQARPQVPTGRGQVPGDAPQKHHQSSAITQNSEETLEWRRSQDITAQPGFASCCLEKGLGAPAACVGLAALLGAVWLDIVAVQLGSCRTKHGEQGRSFGCPEESPRHAEELGWVMLSCHWLSLWDGNFGSGSDGEVGESSCLGREKEGAPGPRWAPWRRGRGGCFGRRLSCPGCVAGSDLGRERSSMGCSAQGDPWGHHARQLDQHAAIPPHGAGTGEGRCRVLAALQ